MHHRNGPITKGCDQIRGQAGDPSRGPGGAAAQEAHARIRDYYLEVAGDTPHYPTLDDLAPLIEVVHHACRAGAYDEAYRVYLERIYQRSSFVLTQKLGAYETAQALWVEFFPDSDSSQEPPVSDSKRKSLILNEVGLCLMNLGRLGEAVPFYERANEIKLHITKDWSNASIGYRNLAELHTHLGALAASAEAAGEALALARRAENKFGQCQSMSFQAWAAHLSGDLEVAGQVFQEAEDVERERHTQYIRYLYSNRGIFHADHLRRGARSTGSRQGADYARRITEANLEICERNRWANQISWCHRVLGDLDADPSAGSGGANHEGAGAHYDQALKIARGITYQPALIEALLARGRWAARLDEDLKGPGRRDVGTLSGLEQATADLNEALGYALEGGYRIYEADIRVALAWAHQAAGDPARARAEAERARQMSADMGYHWGQVDAAEVLAVLE